MIQICCPLLVWAPSSGYRGGRDYRPPCTQDILQRLLTITIKVVCESGCGNTARALFEYQLVATLATLTYLGCTRAKLRIVGQSYGEVVKNIPSMYGDKTN